MSPTKPASFTASRAALVGMLTAASRVAGNSKPIPILGSIWLDAKDGMLTWWATDTHVWRGGSLEVEIAAPGSGLLPVSLTLATLKQCADGPVSLTLATLNATLKSGGFTAKLPLLPAEDYPALPDVPEGGIEIPGASLARMIEQVEPAILAEHSQYEIRGAHLLVSATGVQMTTTDRHRMARSSAPLASQATDSEVIIPVETLREVAAMVSDDIKQSAFYIISGDRHAFRVGSEVVIARTIDSKFPACDRVIPQSWGTRMVCNRDAWLRALGRVSVVTDAKNTCVTVAIADGQMVLTTQSVDRGDAVEQLQVETEGVPLTFKAKPGYLRDFLTAARSESVACEIKDGHSPVALKPIDQDAGDYIYIVMPMVL